MLVLWAGCGTVGPSDRTKWVWGGQGVGGVGGRGGDDGGKTSLPGPTMLQVGEGGGGGGGRGEGSHKMTQQGLEAHVSHTRDRCLCPPDYRGGAGRNEMLLGYRL